MCLNFFLDYDKLFFNIIYEKKNIDKE